MFRIIQYGVGGLGAQVVHAALAREGVAVVGAIDTDPEKVGKDVADVMGLWSPVGLSVSGDAGTTLSSVAADVVLHSTTSFLQEVKDQLLGIIAAGRNVISTCEELAFPTAQHPDIAAELDAAARAAGVTVLGTGVNPGFIIDFFPITLSAVCQEVRTLVVTRIADASQRRLSLQKKIGVGMTPEEFEAKAAEGRMGHVGLTESVALIMAAWGWPLERTTVSLEPVIANEDIRTRYLEVKTGQVAGIHQIARGYVAGNVRIALDLAMHVAVLEAVDSLIIEGVPPIHSAIRGGINGDVATVAIVLNAIPIVVAAPPGLMTMRDLPVPAYWSPGILSRP